MRFLVVFITRASFFLILPYDFRFCEHLENS